VLFFDKILVSLRFCSSFLCAFCRSPVRCHWLDFPNSQRQHNQLRALYRRDKRATRSRRCFVVSSQCSVFDRSTFIDTNRRLVRFSGAIEPRRAAAAAAAAARQKTASQAKTGRSEQKSVFYSDFDCFD
jgi:hypothetical protein